MKYNNKLIIIFYVVVIIFIGILLLCKKYEPFMNQKDTEMNSELGLRYFQTLFGQIKRVSSFLLNKESWSYGLSLHNKSPVELARMYLANSKSTN
jgi:hypothetical protein